MKKRKKLLYRISFLIISEQILDNDSHLSYNKAEAKGNDRNRK